ncbi:hypothetical protein VaNZ11_007138 [Volvox africanus]|uniref:Uncharacterized protein n=1 Tax=Volvox africanus TaxID=51714 RepID=A0ABQ5S287_9CHLO|nr:hypothetical protein VaNZ11_007138 [Volvox africanus]
MWPLTSPSTGTSTPRAADLVPAYAVGEVPLLSMQSDMRWLKDGRQFMSEICLGVPVLQPLLMDKATGSLTVIEILFCGLKFPCVVQVDSGDLQLQSFKARNGPSGETWDYHCCRNLDKKGVGKCST